MTIRIISAANGEFDLSDATQTDRLSLIASDGGRAGVLHLVPIFQLAPALERGSKRYESTGEYLIDARYSTLPSIASKVASCKVTACGPQLFAKFPFVPHIGELGDFVFDIAHKRHSEDVTRCTVRGLIVHDIHVSTATAVEHLDESLAYS